MRTFTDNPPLSDSQSQRPIQDRAAPSATTASIDDWRDEVALDELSAGDRLVVTTRNHTYEIVVEAPWTGEILVRGGRHFPEFTSARLSGSLPGGSSLRIRSVNVGMRLEFVDRGRIVITTQVQKIRLLPEGARQGVM